MGVSFALTDEQKALRELAREFAENEIRPKAAEYDEHSTHPADVIAKAHEVGLMNLHVPEELGGLGLSAFDGMLVGEELYWGCSGIGTSRSARTASAPGRCSSPASEEQKAQWLPPLLEEPILCSFGLSEPDAGSDVARMKTTAERRGDEYVLNGSKTFITNAGHASWTVVFAKTDPTKGHRGISAFIVPMDAPGVTIEKHLDKMGQRSTDTSAFALTDVVVPAANRLGEEGDGFKIAMRTLDFTRPGTAAGAVGVAQAAYELAVDYAKERVTFDVPIAMHQGVNFMIADMATEIEAARLLVWQAAWMLDQGTAGDAAVVVREALRGRHRDEGDDRRRAGLRRLRLHQGVPGREADARREAVPDLRGHLADPAARDRQGDLPAEGLGSLAWPSRSTSAGASRSSPAARAGSAAPTR